LDALTPDFVSPSDVGLTNKQADALIAFDASIELGVDDGGFAGVHFSGDEARNALRQLFVQYAIAEVVFSRPESD
jgi:hypothetical protein